MKVLQYFENPGLISRSGIGHAQRLQQEELSYTDVVLDTSPFSKDYDLIDVNTYGPKSIAMLAKARLENKKIVYHAHSTYEDFRNSFIGSNLLSKPFKRHLINAYKRADLIITPTAYAKTLLRGYGLTQPIIPISNGVRVSSYEKSQSKITKFRQFLNLSADDKRKVIISVGLYFQRKGVMDFVELAKRNPEYLFVWFGYTDLRIIPRKIRKMVQSDHPTNCIFAGYITGDVLQGAYSGADLFLYPSYEETEGIVVLEALASSQKVLVRDIPVYADWLHDGVDCYKAQNLDDFDKQLHLIMSDQVKDVSQQGYEVALTRDVSVIGPQLKAAYEEALALISGDSQ
ncbi:glycosyltransferase [Oenococcus sicerae]|uniref:glycosyltransferase n=1 Tax=Oenococcus sicerae TaxID=2203724 RepID=UPI0010B49258|nr:Processive diacylglycerol alpha-glucosyltransferase [Oenococcus sicerae]